MDIIPLYPSISNILSYHILLFYPYISMFILHYPILKSIYISLFIQLYPDILSLNILIIISDYIQLYLLVSNNSNYIPKSYLIISRRTYPIISFVSNYILFYLIISQILSDCILHFIHLYPLLSRYISS